MPRPRVFGLFLAAAALLTLGVLHLRRDESSPKYVDAGDSAATTPPDPASEEIAASALPAEAPTHAPNKPLKTAVLKTLAWGGGIGEIGQLRGAEGEGEGETPLRLAVGVDGMVLLDNTNQRLVRLGLDGQQGRALRLATKDPRDVAIARDGTLVVLSGEADRGAIMLLDSEGKTRGTLAVPPGIASTARSIVVSGSDVYVESHQGELTRVGDVSGTVDPQPALAPGLPTRDGRGFVTARIANPESGAVHVYVVERGSLAQRFSREVRPRLFVEGIFLIDTSPAGTIYIGVTGNEPGGGTSSTRAELLCIEPQRGDVIGSVDVPVRVGPEAILDAKALDTGGVVYSVFTKQGVRVERLDCD